MTMVASRFALLTASNSMVWGRGHQGYILSKRNSGLTAFSLPLFLSLTLTCGMVGPLLKHERQQCRDVTVRLSEPLGRRPIARSAKARHTREQLGVEWAGVTGTFSPLKIVAPLSKLTPSLPWCHLKTVQVGNFKSLSLLVFFALTCERIFIKTQATEIRFVIRPGNILSSGAYVHFSTRKFYMLGQWRG